MEVEYSQRKVRKGTVKNLEENKKRVDLRKTTIAKNPVMSKGNGNIEKIAKPYVWKKTEMINEI